MIQFSHLCVCFFMGTIARFMFESVFPSVPSLVITYPFFNGQSVRSTSENGFCPKLFLTKLHIRN